MSTSKSSLGDSTYNDTLKNLSYYINFTDPTSASTVSYKMDPVTVWANLKSIHRKMPDDNKLCPKFDLKTGISRVDAWKLFLNALRAYLRAIGSELLEIFDAREFLPPFPQYLSSEIQAWLPEWLMEIFVPSGLQRSSVKLSKKAKESKKSKDVSEMVTQGYDQS